METRGMTKELLSSWVTLPVYRDTLLNHIEKGRGGGRWMEKESRQEKKGEIEKRRGRRRERLRKGGRKRKIMIRGRENGEA